MNHTPKLDERSKKCIVLGRVSKVGGGCLVQVPKALKDMVGIIKIAESIEIDGLERKSGRASSQRALAEICPEAKRPNKFGLLYQHKTSQRYNFQQRWHQRRKNTQCWKQKKWRYATKANHACVADGMLEGGFVLPRQIMLVPRMEC